MQLAIMRHGLTPSNERRCYIGALDEPLSQAGVHGAQRAGVYDGLALVYVSPLARARQTAAICFPRAEQVVVDDLREIAFGAFEGRSADDMADDASYRAWVEGGCIAAPPGGEAYAAFVRRSMRGVGWVLADARSRGLQHVAIVAHGGTAMAAMSSFYDADPLGVDSTSYFSWHVGNCEGYVVELAFDAAGTPQPGAYRRFQRVEGLFA